MIAKGFSRTGLTRLHDVMAGHVERGLPGLVALVSRRGETHVDPVGALSIGGAPMQRDSLFRIASMSKPVTAVAAMMLVEDCRMRLDDSVEGLLPELANRRVMKRIDGSLDDNVPAARAITLRDLLSFRFGLGGIFDPPGNWPIQTAMAQAGLAPGPDQTQLTPDEWMRRLGALPLVHQPGEGWHYHTGSDVLGVLIARATGQSFEDFLQARIFEPLGMKDTGFHVPEGKLDRLVSSYQAAPGGEGLVLHDDPNDTAWARPPVFASGGAGLVSTADDYLAFSRMLLNGGRLGGVRLLSRPSVSLMTTDQLTPEQRAAGRLLLRDTLGWGLGMAVNIGREQIWESVGRFGWDGGRGTTAWSDPSEDMVGILMTARMMDSPAPPLVFQDFWTAAYAAIED